MTKIIGIKELQTNTKKIRQEVEKGVHFIVVWRSNPIFEIKPLDHLKTIEFADTLEATGLYKKSFIKRMQAAEDALKSGKVRKYGSMEEFLKSLS